MRVITTTRRLCAANCLTSIRGSGSGRGMSVWSVVTIGFEQRVTKSRIRLPHSPG